MATKSFRGTASFKSLGSAGKELSSPKDTLEDDDFNRQPVRGLVAEAPELWICTTRVSLSLRSVISITS